MENTSTAPKRTAMTVGVMLLLALLAGALFIGKTGIFQWMGLKGISAGAMYVTRLIFWLVLGITFLYARQVEKQRLLLWEERPYSFPLYLASVFGIFGAIIVLLLFTAILLRVLGVPQHSAKLDELMNFFRDDPFLMIFTCLTAGFVEELLFRGYLLPRMALLFNSSIAAVIVSSVLFGLMHFGYGTIINMVGPFVIGLVFAIYYWKFRNIKVLIFCHFAWDLMALLLKLLMMKYNIKT